MSVALYPHMKSFTDSVQTIFKDERLYRPDTAPNQFVVARGKRKAATVATPHKEVVFEEVDNCEILTTIIDSELHLIHKVQQTVPPNTCVFLNDEGNIKGLAFCKAVIDVSVVKKID